MIAWIDSLGLDSVVMVIAAALLFVATIIFFGLWLAVSRRARRERAARAAAERVTLDLDLILAEQTARFRMVRELHEMAIHSVSGILKQAEGARYAAEGDPGAAARAAAVIADSARSTVEDLRRVLAIAKHGEADSGPQPGIKTARELFRVMREAGLEIQFEETGERFDLLPGAELAVYRILQESLSNSLRYGGEGTSVTVAFRWSPQSVQVLVDDDGVRTQTRKEGRDPNVVSRQGGYTIDEDAAALTAEISGPGLTEMRERTELFGGVFQAYRVPGVGFSVAASFPLNSAGRAVQPGESHPV